MVDEDVARVSAFLVGRDRTERVQVVGVTMLVAGTLGLLLVLAQYDVVALPGWVYLGLFLAGLSVASLVNGHRDGGVAVSWLASGLGAFPLALAFAPSGPYTLPPGAILAKAIRWTAVLGLVAGSVFHAVGWLVGRWVATYADGVDRGGRSNRRRKP